jgi:hypothetical protein
VRSVGYETGYQSSLSPILSQSRVAPLFADTREGPSAEIKTVHVAAWRACAQAEVLVQSSKVRSSLWMP